MAHPLRQFWLSRRSGVIRMIVALWMAAFIYNIPFDAAVTFCYDVKGSRVQQRILLSRRAEMLME